MRSDLHQQSHPEFCGEDFRSLHVCCTIMCAVISIISQKSGPKLYYKMFLNNIVHFLKRYDVKFSFLLDAFHTSTTAKTANRILANSLISSFILLAFSAAFDHIYGFVLGSPSADRLFSVVTETAELSCDLIAEHGDNWSISMTTEQSGETEEQLIRRSRVNFCTKRSF